MLACRTYGGCFLAETLAAAIVLALRSRSATIGFSKQKTKMINGTKHHHFI